jgi:hypothetical protein
MDEVPYKRCGALTTAGTRCGRRPYPGGTRCNLHGGASPQAKAVAARTLAIARDYAAEVLQSVLADYLAETCPVCGRPSGDPRNVIRAAVAVLDRTGLHKTVAVQIESDIPGWVAYLPEDQLEQIGIWIQAATARMSPAPLALPAPVMEEVVPAEVVEDGVLIEADDPGDDPGGDGGDDGGEA